MISRLKQLLFQNRNVRQTVIKNMFWLSFGQIVSRGVRAFIIIYSARVLGTAEYGVFSYALGLAGFFTIFADLGLSPILTREVAQKPEKASHYFATAFWLKVALTFFTILAILFISPYFSNVARANAILPLIALLVIFDNVREFVNAYFRAKERMELEAFVALFMNIAIAICGFIILQYYHTARAVAIAYVGSAGLGMLAAIFLLKEEFMGVVRNVRTELMRGMFSSAWSLAIISLLGAFMLNIDVVMLGWLTSASDIGLYSAGLRIVQVLYILPAIIASSIFPALARTITERNTARTRAIMERTMTMAFLLAFPVAVGGVVLGAPIMRFVFGEQYALGIASFQILMATVLFVFPGALIGNYIVAHNRQGDIAKFVMFASLGNALFDYLFIPRLGIAGSSVATFIVQLFYNAFMWRFAKQIGDFHTLRHIVKIGAASLAMGILAVALSVTGMHVLITIAISSIAYLGILVLIKEPTIMEVIATVRAARRAR